MRVHQLHSSSSSHHRSPSLLQRLRLRTRLNQLPMSRTALFNMNRCPIQIRFQSLHHIHHPLPKCDTIIQILFRNFDVGKHFIDFWLFLLVCYRYILIGFVQESWGASKSYGDARVYLCGISRHKNSQKGWLWLKQGILYEKGNPYDLSCIYLWIFNENAPQAAADIKKQVCTSFGTAVERGIKWTTFDTRSNARMARAATQRSLRLLFK